MSLLQNAGHLLMWLTVPDMILCLLNLAVLVWYAVPVRKHYRWFDFVPSLGVLVALLIFLLGDATLPALALDSLTVVIFICTIRRVFKPSAIAASRSRVMRVFRVLICACGILPIILVPMMAGEMRYNPVSDLSEKDYPEAFAAMNKRLSVEYPFGEWKHINWDELKTKYEPVFAEAQRKQDKELYYKTLREYLFAMRDGHIRITNENLYDGNTLFKKEVGGGFGISTVQLDDGRVLVSLVLAGSPAEKSGIKLGAEILTWDDQSAQNAYKQTFWSESQSATDEGGIQDQGRFMARAPIGKEVQVAYRNWETHTAAKVTLKAYDDDYETLKKTRFKLVPADLETSFIESRIVNGYGYVKIKHLLPKSMFAEPEKELEEVLKSFGEKQIKGLILDVRNNPGGDDALAAKIAGYFVNKEKIYEYVSYYNRYTGQFEINRNETAVIKPAEPHYSGPIAVLINQRTGSSGEGIPLALKGMPNVKIVGFTSTGGSFGVMSSPIEFEMPEGYNIQFPDGRSLNEEKRIQLDADDTRRGGVAPDIKIPLNEETFKEKVLEGQDVDLNKAVEALKSLQ